jgi:ERF superfamily
MSGQAASKPRQEETSARASLDYHQGYLCVRTESATGKGAPNGGPPRITREWYPLHRMSEAEARALVGRPLKEVDRAEGLYVDEEGRSFQLANQGKTRPIDRSVVAVTTNRPSTTSDSGKSGRKPRRTRPAQLDLPATATRAPSAVRPASADRSRGDATGARPTPRASGRRPLPLNTLAQKLAEVRRRIGYIQKRGHNELFGYRYAMAADIASAVGDALAELGVIVIPHLDSISSEPLPAARERVVRVVMDYTLIDAQTGERETIRVAGEGRDPGDKGPYKAMTGALKYALLQAFLIATGDDPENERGEGQEGARSPAPATIGPEQARELARLLEKSGTEVERVLEYFKVARLEDLSEAAHRKALQILSRKRAQGAAREASHAQG